MEGINGFSVATYLSNFCLNLEGFTEEFKRFQKAILTPKKLEARLFTSNEEKKLKINYSKENEEEKRLKSIHGFKNVQKVALKWKIEAEIESKLGEIMQIAENFLRVFAENERIKIKNAKLVCKDISHEVSLKIKQNKECFELRANEVSSQALSNCLISHFAYELEYELDIQEYLKRCEQSIGEIVEDVSILNGRAEIQKQIGNVEDNLYFTLTSAHPLNALSIEHCLDELREVYGELEFRKTANTLSFAFPWMAIIQR